MHKRIVSLTLNVTSKADGSFVARYEVVHKAPGWAGFAVFVTLPHAARFIPASEGTQEHAAQWARTRVAAIHSYPDLQVTETT